MTITSAPLLPHLDQLSYQLQCGLCSKLLHNPYTFSECGHTFCRACLMRALEDTRGRRCPQCGGPVLIKNLRKNAAFGTIVACVKKMADILQGCNLHSVPLGSPTSMVGRARPVRRGTPKTPNSQMGALCIETPAGKESPIITPIRRQSLHSKQLSNQGKMETPKSTTKRPVKATPSSSAKKSKTGTPLAQSITVAGEHVMESLQSPPTTTTTKSPSARIMARDRKGRQALQPFVFLTTGLTEDQKEIIASSYDKISPNRKVALRHAYTPNSQITHIISSCTEQRLCPRTFKYMRGILDGVHIVSYHWFLASLTGNRFVSERDYWIKGDEVVGQVTNAVEKSIKNSKGRGSLFKGLSFFLVGSFGAPSPPKSDLNALIMAGAGKIATRKPKSPTNDLWIIHDGSTSIRAFPNEEFPQQALWSQLLDCISRFSLEPLLPIPK